MVLTSVLIGIIAGILVLVVIAGIVIYNRLVRLRNMVKASWADIDVNLKKRYDLVPPLVETVKGYAAHEKTVLEKVTEARSKAMHAATPKAKAGAEGILGETLKSLFALSEAYPDLKANATFMELQGQLKELEDNIAFARSIYNSAVRDFNVYTESFPSNIIASQFRFEKEAFFGLETPEVERKPVTVSFP